MADMILLGLAVICTAYFMIIVFYAGMGTSFAFIWLFGVLFIDGVGAVWLAFATHITIGQSLIANLAFIPGDSIKTVATLLVAQALLKNKTVAAQLQ